MKNSPIILFLVMLALFMMTSSDPQQRRTHYIEYETDGGGMPMLFFLGIPMIIVGLHLFRPTEDPDGRVGFSETSYQKTSFPWPSFPKLNTKGKYATLKKIGWIGLTGVVTYGCWVLIGRHVVNYLLGFF